MEQGAASKPVGQRQSARTAANNNNNNASKAAQQQQQQQQQQKHEQFSGTAALTNKLPTANGNCAASATHSAAGSVSMLNTAKLPVDTVKQLIAAVSKRPNLWIRKNTNGQKRSDIAPLWQEVGQDVNLPADVCRIKWGHLRDNFRKVFIRNTFSNEAPTTWRFYHDMKFMEESVADNIQRQSLTRSSSSNGIANGNGCSGGGNGRKSKPFSVVPICQLAEGYDDDELQEPSFTDITSFFEDQSPPQMPASKRIKLEYPTQQQQQQHALPPPPPHMVQMPPHLALLNLQPSQIYGSSLSSDYDHSDEQPLKQELNDDDFDEDAASEENEDCGVNTLNYYNHQDHQRRQSADNLKMNSILKSKNNIMHNLHHNNNNNNNHPIKQSKVYNDMPTTVISRPDIPTIELCDDDDDDDDDDEDEDDDVQAEVQRAEELQRNLTAAHNSLAARTNGALNGKASNLSGTATASNISPTAAASKNTQKIKRSSTESSAYGNGQSSGLEPMIDEDPDRMFLLSLLPFFQKVDDRKKLSVRQKFHNILAEVLD